MLRLLLASSKWLLVPVLLCLQAGCSRSPLSWTIGWEVVFAELWDPVGDWGITALPFVGAVLLLASRMDLSSPRVALRRASRHPVCRGVLALFFLALVASALAHEESYRRVWRAYFEAYEDYVPVRYRSLGVFSGPWPATANLSHHLFMFALACFGTWLLTRTWLARNLAHSAGVTSRDPHHGVTVETVGDPLGRSVVPDTRRSGSSG